MKGKLEGDDTSNSVLKVHHFHQKTTLLCGYENRCNNALTGYCASDEITIATETSQRGQRQQYVDKGGETRRPVE
jgi:hypothetical protein